jgi:hypothetical protein
VVRRGKGLVEEIQHLENNSRALQNHRCQVPGELFPPLPKPPRLPGSLQ